MRANINVQLQCPDCDWTLVIDELKHSGVKMLYCPNQECKHFGVPYAPPTVELRPWTLKNNT